MVTTRARAFQATVGCIDAARGGALTSRRQRGPGRRRRDAVGTESNGTVVAWQRADGKACLDVRAATVSRKLTAPLLLGRSVVIGDDAGLVHLLSRADAAPLNRLDNGMPGIAAGARTPATRWWWSRTKGGVYGSPPTD